MTVKEFCEKHQISATIKPANSNPNIPDKEMCHYRITLKNGLNGNKMTVPFSTGTGWKRQPNVEDVINCLVSDASCVQNSRNFENWCSDLGYNSDPRKAKRVYEACEKQTNNLKNLLGHAYNDVFDCDPL